MREIYRSATQVYIWLGLDNPLTSRGMDFIDEIYQFLPRVEIDVERDGSDPKIYMNGKPLQKGFMPIGVETRKQFRTYHFCFDFITEMAWWSRVWVVQELAMAKAEPIVMCGHKCIPWSKFEFWGYVDDAARSSPYA